MKRLSEADRTAAGLSWRAHDLSGRRYGRLVAVSPAGRGNNRTVLWACKCDCGGSATYSSASLGRGRTNSCGCALSDAAKLRIQKATAALGGCVIWEMSHRADPRGCALADRHYSRQTIGADQFMPPGSCVVFYAETTTGRAIWGTSAPFAEWVKHRWAGAWMCSIFRNEGAGVASAMITEAVAATKAFYGDPPAHGMLTFIDRTKVRPTMVHGEPVWGWTYRKAGFLEAGEIQGGLLALQLRPEHMPPPEHARQGQMMLAL